MKQLAYYWVDFDLVSYVSAIGTCNEAADAMRWVFGNQYTKPGLSPWYPWVLAPDILAHRMGRDWYTNFDFAIVFEQPNGRPIGYLIRSPSQTLDLEENHD